MRIQLHGNQSQGAVNALLMVGALLLSGVSSAGADDSKAVRIDGSSTVFPVTEAVAEEFQLANPGTQITVGVAGTGGGFKKFLRNEIDIAGASRPISASEMEEAKKAEIEYIELPIAYDALTVMVNPSNTWVDKLTVAELKKIWEPNAQGKVTKWSQVREGFPDQEIRLYGAGADSGTFDYFTEAIVGKAKSSRGDYTASEDDNVLVQGIGGDKNALGYFGYSYYAENKDKLKAIPIQIEGGKAVLPSPTTVLDGTYKPLSRPIFIYVNKASLSRPIVKTFVDFYLEQGPALVEEVKYVPLDKGAYDKAKARFASAATGSAFGGNGAIGLRSAALFDGELHN